MSPSEREDDQTTGIDDDQLPPDLRPSEENPLAEPLTEEDDAEPDDLDMDGGKLAEEMDEPADDVEADTEG